MGRVQERMARKGVCERDVERDEWRSERKKRTEERMWRRGRCEKRVEKRM